MSNAFGQEYSDNAPTSYVSIGFDDNGNGPSMYKDSEGYSIVNGIVFNDGDNPVTDVRIQVNFFDDFDSNPLEVVSGNTILQVISPNGQSSFTIRSLSPNSDISGVVVDILGFVESVLEPTPLTVIANKLIYQSGDNITISGSIKNLADYTQSVTITDSTTTSSHLTVLASDEPTITDTASTSSHLTILATDTPTITDGTNTSSHLSILATDQLLQKQIHSIL